MDSLVQLALSPSALLIRRSCGGAELGTPEERSALLKTERIQTFLSTAYNTLQNGGPRTDQEYKFNCRLVTLYPLHFAAMVGDVDTIKLLIHDQHRDPNMKCPEMNDIQAIGLAAAYGHLLAVIALLTVTFITVNHHIHLIICYFVCTYLKPFHLITLFVSLFSCFLSFHILSCLDIR